MRGAFTPWACWPRGLKCVPSSLQQVEQVPRMGLAEVLRAIWNEGGIILLRLDLSPKTAPKGVPVWWHTTTR